MKRRFSVAGGAQSKKQHRTNTEPRGSEEQTTFESLPPDLKALVFSYAYHDPQDAGAISKEVKTILPDAAKIIEQKMNDFGYDKVVVGGDAMLEAFERVSANLKLTCPCCG